MSEFLCVNECTIAQFLFGLFEEYLRRKICCILEYVELLLDFCGFESITRPWVVCVNNLRAWQTVVRAFFNCFRIHCKLET